MSEYIIEWSGIGARIVELIGSVPTYLIPKRLREERLREPIVRCRDCVKFSEQEPGGEIGTCELGLEDTGLVSIVEPNGFCSWGERRTNDQMETQD